MQKLLFILQNHWKNILLVVLSLALITITSLHFILRNDKPLENNNALSEATIAKTDIDETSNNTVETVKKMHVDVKGAVKKAGVYEVTEDMMITDVIVLAGGFAKNAYQNGINLSKKVSDEMVIYVYTKAEIEDSKPVVDNTCAAPTYNICECVEENSSVIVPGESSTNQSVDKTDDKPAVVNINTASKTDLTTIKGIGESKAEAIISYREKNGKFTKIEDLKNVSGIGDAVFEKIKDYITV